MDVGGDHVNSKLMLIVLQRNIWGPDGGVDHEKRLPRNKNVGVADQLGAHYGFSPRLRAIIKTTPTFNVAKSTTKKPNRIKQKLHMENKLTDEEKGDLPKTSLDSTTAKEPVKALPKLSHYSIVQQMYNYHAVDFGDKCEGSRRKHVYSQLIPLESSA